MEAKPKLNLGCRMSLKLWVLWHSLEKRFSREHLQAIASANSELNF